MNTESLLHACDKATPEILERSIMTVTDIDAVIIKELGKLTDGSVTVTAETNIVRQLNLPSLDVMELVMSLEDHFDISIPLDRIADIETVQELAALVRTLRTGTDAS